MDVPDWPGLCTIAYIYIVVYSFYGGKSPTHNMQTYPCIKNLYKADLEAKHTIKTSSAEEKHGMSKTTGMPYNT